MSKEDIDEIVKDKKSKRLLLELPTGFGKTLFALKWLEERYSYNKLKILIVVPRLVLFNTWREEIKKWEYDHLLDKIEFSTYVSLHKHPIDQRIIVFDECHHLSERCREILSPVLINCKNPILFMSATVKRDIKVFLGGIKSVKVTAKTAIDTGILPDPVVYLLPMQLNNKDITEKIIKNPKGSHAIQVHFRDRFRYKNLKGTKIVIPCTQTQYYEDISSLIKWYKNKSSNKIMKNLWLHKAGERLKWLSNKKTTIVKELLKYCSRYRTLTFCNDINQTEEVGKYCINSKNKKSKEWLELFNNKKINHITACNMLDEGVNLSSCRVGIYAVLNSSDRMIIQKMGRLLRHPHPVIIIPYFINTRDEEIVEKMCDNYNPSLIKVIKNIKDIKF